MPRAKKKLQEINASSMADIAFLLLIFFLVTTTMDIDKGLRVLMPPYSPDPPPETKQNQRNVLKILINGTDELLVQGEPLDVAELRELTIKHVNNKGRDPEHSVSTKKAVVSLKNCKSTSYEAFITVQNELRAAYNEMRDEYSQREFSGVIYNDLDSLRQRIVRNEYPLRISEADPEPCAGEEGA